MLSKATIIAFIFVLGMASGIGLSALRHRLSLARMSGFSSEDAQAKLGRTVELKENALEGTSKVINTGTVVYIDERCGYRYLVIEWDKLLPGMKHPLTSIGPDTYKKFIIED